MNETMRLQKYMAAAGVASRRKSEDLIARGLVKVNGETVTEPGYKVNPAVDKVSVNGEEISAEKKVYLLLNKPVGYICTSEDPYADKTVFDLVPKDIRLHTVGRLDKNTEGLILLTNDGELTQKLTHPSHQVQKTYQAVVKGRVSKQELDRLKQGVIIKEDDGRELKTSKAQAKILSRSERTSTLEITIHEGHKRQIRKMCEAIGHPVIALKRTREDFLTLKGLGRGKWRYLESDEVKRLKND